MIDSHYNGIIIRRRMGVLNGKKLNIKPIGYSEGNYLRKFSIATSLHGVIYLGEPKRPYLERLVLNKMFNYNYLIVQINMFIITKFNLN